MWTKLKKIILLAIIFLLGFIIGWFTGFFWNAIIYFGVSNEILNSSSNRIWFLFL